MAARSARPIAHARDVRPIAHARDVVQVPCAPRPPHSPAPSFGGGASDLSVYSVGARRETRLPGTKPGINRSGSSAHVPPRDQRRGAERPSGTTTREGVRPWLRTAGGPKTGWRSTSVFSSSSSPCSRSAANGSTSRLSTARPSAGTPTCRSLLALARSPRHDIAKEADGEESDGQREPRQCARKTRCGKAIARRSAKPRPNWRSPVGHCSRGARHRDPGSRGRDRGPGLHLGEPVEGRGDIGIAWLIVATVGYAYSAESATLIVGFPAIFGMAWLARVLAGTGSSSSTASST